MAESEEVRREAHELAILSGAFVRLAQRLNDRARALDEVVNGGLAHGSVSPQNAGEARRDEDPLAPAVLMATNLAALGHSREEIRTYLTDAFELEDPEVVLDRALSS